ncbi:hypothetical protein BDW72DRAFT_118729 [Aspergillus terricola var. indicus]
MCPRLHTPTRFTLSLAFSSVMNTCELEDCNFQFQFADAEPLKSMQLAIPRHIVHSLDSGTSDSSNFSEFSVLWSSIRPSHRSGSGSIRPSKSRPSIRLLKVRFLYRLNSRRLCRLTTANAGRTDSTLSSVDLVRREKRQ